MINNILHSSFIGPYNANAIIRPWAPEKKIQRGKNWRRSRTKSPEGGAGVAKRSGVPMGIRSKVGAIAPRLYRGIGPILTLNQCIFAYF